MVTVPRVVLAAPASGHGKTTVSTGIMAALTRRGIAVTGHKVGPDFIDPGYHALATGRPGRNLDPFLVGEDRVAPLLLHGAAAGDVAVIEGVMGLHDGRLGSEGFASTAHVARLTESPVVMVVDVSHAARTIAAMVDGVARFDPRAQVAGVILNRVASPRQSAEIRSALTATGLPVVGELGRDSRLHVPSRHLGLVPAAERDEAGRTLETLADLVEQGIDLDAVLAIARSAAPLEVGAWDAATQVGPAVDGAPVVAVAGGRAFTFRYAEHEELLRAAGCEVVEFDPLRDPALPSGTRALYLGGGFPEVHAAGLAENHALRREIRTAVNDGLPTVAECAGLIYLCRSLDGRPMAGALEADARMTPRLTLGYRRGTSAREHLLSGGGATISGHEFHRTTVTPRSGPASWTWDGTEEGFASGSLVASYLHVHWAGHPDHARRFAAAAATSVPTTSAAVAPSTSGPVVAAVSDPLRHHGDVETGTGLVDFAVNVHEDGPPPWLTQALRDATADVASYPDPSRATAAVAVLHGRARDEVLLTAGAAEAFTLVARARPWRHAVVVHPQFTEPDVALAAAGRTATRVLLSPDDDFRLEPAHVPEDADLVVVGNPTNPTGVLHDPAVVRSLLRPGRLLVVDEAFMDAVPGEPGTLAGAAEPGLVVLRSLTKLWAIPGVRAGYVLADPSVIAELRAQQPPWSVSAAALAAVEAITRHGDAARHRRAEDLASATDDLVGALDAIGVRAVPGAAPFVLARVPHGTHAALRDRGFAVRRADTFPGLDDGWIRIAVRRSATTAPLVDALAEVVGGGR